MVFVAELVVEFVAEVVPDESAGAGKVVETKSEDTAESVADFMNDVVLAVVAEVSAAGGGVSVVSVIEEDVAEVSAVALQIVQ